MTDMTELARRVVAAPRWRWMPGMLWVQVRPAPLETIRLRVADIRPRDGWDIPGDAVPDLTDPATVGCLRALVVDAWGRDHDIARFATHTEHGVEIWYRMEQIGLDGWNAIVTTPDMIGSRYIGGQTLVEALVEAMEHTPSRVG